jgi:hypothetical protein
VVLSETDALLTPVTRIDGFRLACLIDASTGMVLAAVKDQDDIDVPPAAAAAVDIANALTLMTGELAADGLEDVMVTFRGHFQLIRLVRAEPEPQILLLVVLDRVRANLALARREIRQFCVGLAS